MKSPLLFSLLILICTCTPPTPKLESLFRLTPPGDVRVRCETDSCRITWLASTHEDDPDFAGYQIYISNTSLLFASSAQLPIPITVSRSKKIMLIEKPVNPVFIHMRSFTDDRKISLPSLPELYLEN